MSVSASHLRRSPDWPQVLCGGLLIAIGDILFAIAVWFSWTSAGVIRVFQTIAVGVLGKASYEGGVATALLGAGLHLFMATMFVVAYAVVGQRVPKLLRKPFVHGPLYGTLMYVIMNFVVMPLSRVGATPSFKHLDWIGMSLVAHMVFGVVCVLSARRALRLPGSSGAP